jgi:hypothetical protein
LDLSVSDSKLLTFEVTQSWFSGERHDTTARACSRPPQQRQHAHGKATAKSAVRSEKATRQEIAPVKPTQEGGRTGQTQRHADARLPPHRPVPNDQLPGGHRERHEPWRAADSVQTGAACRDVTSLAGRPRGFPNSKSRCPCLFRAPELSPGAAVHTQARTGVSRFRVRGT